MSDVVGDAGTEMDRAKLSRAFSGEGMGFSQVLKDEGEAPRRKVVGGVLGKAKRP